MSLGKKKVQSDLERRKLISYLKKKKSLLRKTLKKLHLIPKGALWEKQANEGMCLEEKLCFKLLL